MDICNTALSFNHNRLLRSKSYTEGVVKPGGRNFGRRLGAWARQRIGLLSPQRSKVVDFPAPKSSQGRIYHALLFVNCQVLIRLDFQLKLLYF